MYPFVLSRDRGGKAACCKLSQNDTLMFVCLAEYNSMTEKQEQEKKEKFKFKTKYLFYKNVFFFFLFIALSV